MKYTVYGEGIGHQLGEANSFGECKKIHRKWLEEINHPEKDAYAGLCCESDYLKEGMAFAAFYA
jgi:hypothetical protein